MAKIGNPKIKKLDDEFEAKFAEWQAKQSPLERSLDKLKAMTVKTEAMVNNNQLRQVAVVNGDGTIDAKEMEKTFRIGPSVSQATSGDLNMFRNAVEQRRIEDELRERNKEDLGETDSDDETSFFI